MAITNAQQAKQVMNESRPMKKIKGQDHMLAYITPKEAGKLVALGGQETMTKEGIPAYPESEYYGVSQSDFKKGDFTKSRDENVRNLATGKTGVTQQQLAATNKAEAKAKAEEEKRKNFIKNYIKDRQKLAFNASMLIPGQKKRSAKYQKAYKDYLESMGVTPPDTLTGEEDDLADFFINNAFDRTSPSYKDPITDEVKSIQNYGDFIAENFGAPGVKYSGNVGGLETFVKTRDADGKPLTYGFREKRGGERDDFILPISQPVASVPEPTGYVNPLSLLTPRIAGTRFLGTEFEDEEDTEFAADGGRIGAMGGGIMNVEDLDREAFLLGGIAKGLKKAVRGVKKIIKSPLGKAALIGAGFGLAGMGPFKGLANTGFGKGLAGLRGTLLGQAGSRVGEAFVPYKEGLLTKLGLTKGGGSFMPTFKGGITLASILPLLAGKTDEEKDDILKDYYASQKLIPSTTSRQAGSEFDFYEYNLAEGGMPSKEPVAKKVMPLLDMDGMEKDYRAEGGFVPIGRMEKADDVPARLSKNEFVFTADAVRNAGEGDVDKGAEVMYNMMKNLEAGGEVSEESQGLDGAREMFQTSQRLGEVI